LTTHGFSVLGIDTHKHTHVAVILDGLGRPQGTLQIPATDAGAAQLLAWSQGFGSPMTAGVEGTGSYGYQLTRALQAAGITVLEVNRPDRANRRRKGKSDPIDAEAAARAVLAGQASAVPKNREGAVEALRALTMARNSAVKATTTASNQIKALLVGAEQDLRAHAGPEPAAAGHPRQPACSQQRAARRPGQPRPALAHPAHRGPRPRPRHPSPDRPHRT